MGLVLCRILFLKHLHILLDMTTEDALLWASASYSGSAPFSSAGLKPGKFLALCGTCKPPSAAPLRAPHMRAPVTLRLIPTSRMHLKGFCSDSSSSSSTWYSPM